MHIPIINVSGKNIEEAWENSFWALHDNGLQMTDDRRMSSAIMVISEAKSESDEKIEVPENIIESLKEGHKHYENTDRGAWWAYVLQFEDGVKSLNVNMNINISGVLELHRTIRGTAKIMEQVAEEMGYKTGRIMCVINEYVMDMQNEHTRKLLETAKAEAETEEPETEE